MTDAVSRAPALDECLARAHQLAVAQGHGTVALEHLLFALTDDPDAVAILGASRISNEQLRIDVSAHLGRVSETAPIDSGAAPRPGADLLRILQLAGMAARQSQRRMMDGGIVLAAIIGDGNSPAAGLLKAHGLTFEDVIRVLQSSGAPRQQEVAPPPVRPGLPPPSASPDPAQQQPRPSGADDALANARARVRQAEPAAMKPYIAPAPAAPPTQSPPPSQPPEPPGLAHPSAPEPIRETGRAEVPQRIETLSEPPLSRREAATAPAPPRPEPVPLEPARARAASLPSEPITVPVTTPATEPTLSRLRPSAPPPPPAPPPQIQAQQVQPNKAQAYQAQSHQVQAHQVQAHQAQAHQRPQPTPPHQQYQPRPVPAVAPRPQTPYATLPPPGPAPGPRPALPQRVDLPPLPPLQPPPPSQPNLAPLILPPHALLPSEPLEIVQAAAGLPAVVRRNVPVLVEIRIPRGQVDVPRHGPQSMGHGPTILRAVTTRLTGGPVSGLSIEPRTPETAWLGPADADSRDVIWQYVLLPTRAGTFGVTLSVSGRTLAPGGMNSDVSTSAETFAVRVKPERGRFWRRLLGTVFLLGLGGAVGWALTGPLAGLVKALIEVARGSAG